MGRSSYESIVINCTTNTEINKPCMYPILMSRFVCVLIREMASFFFMFTSNLNNTDPIMM